MLNSALNIYDYITSSGKMISEDRMEKDVKGTAVV